MSTATPGSDAAQTLAQLVAERGPLGAADVLELVSRLLDAVSPLHAAGNAYGALDPDHVLVTPPRDASERPRVDLAPPPDSGPRELSWWMSPEQMDASGAAPGPASDLWSVALVAFFALTGQRYWFEIRGAPVSVASRFIVEASERAREYGCGDRIPPGFDAWFSRCLARDPAARHASTEEAKSALEAALCPAPVAAAGPQYANPYGPAVNPYAPAAPQYPNPYSAAARPFAGGYGTMPYAAAPAPSSTSGCTIAAIIAAVVCVAFVALFAVAGVAGYLAARDRAAPVATTTGTGRAGRGAHTASPRSTYPTAVPAPSPTVLPPPSPTADTKVYVVPIAGSPAEGAPDALVTVVEFSDFQCPYCKRVVPTISAIRERYGADLRVVWKDNPLPFHARAEPCAELAREARAEQGDAGFFRAHDKIFASNPKLEADDLDAVATSLGLRPGAAGAAIATKRYAAAIKTDADLATSIEASGTPTFFINGRKLTGSQPVDTFAALIDEQLARAKQRVAGGTPRGKVYDAIMAEASAAR